ncbi:hypothetical protein M5689_024126 [Euphorbia peplus]|nr:hypothetical protein M5689_024126 [Euphorbia peplus]
MMIVDSLLEVASHPEYDIASMTFIFGSNAYVNRPREVPEYETSPDELDFTNSVEITKLERVPPISERFAVY